MSGRERLSVLLLIILMNAGCSSKGKVPGGILPQDKMEALVWDMAQADQYASIFVARDSARIDLKKETLRLYEEVFRLHHVTRAEFSKSYRYYLDHPELNQLLFDSVITRGVRDRSEMYDRPYYRPPTQPVAVPLGVKTAAGGKGPLSPGRPGPAGAVMPGKHFPGGAVMPGPLRGVTPGMPADALRRMREAAMRRSQDSMARALHRRINSMRGPP